MGLPRLASVCFLFLLQISISVSLPQSILRYLPETIASLSTDDQFSVHGKITPKDYLFCDSWRYTVETNDAGTWSRFPTRCREFVRNYMTGERYWSDCEAVADCALEFATSVNVSGDGKDAWVFDIDETLLSNLFFFLLGGFRPHLFDEQSLDQSWVSWSPPIPSSLRLYNELKKLKFKIFLLTGRDESVRALTLLNLKYAGYTGFERLILRQPEDEGTPATVFKPKKRKELEDEGYRIRGSSGDQWSDLTGYALAERSFKIPNPMYYVA